MTDLWRTGWSEMLPTVSTAGRVLLILLIAWALLWLSQRLIRHFRIYMQARASCEEDAKRIVTLGRAFRYIAAVIITLMAGTLVLSEVGISIAPILGAAGVVGVAVGFGAQSLIKDYFTGFFLLLENQIRQGDVVEIADKGGLVEEITLRYVRMRDYDGNVHYIPNGLITTVVNKSRDYAMSVVDVGVAYREDVDEALAVMEEVAVQMRASESFGPRILEDVEMVGVERWEDSAVILRCRLKVKPLEQWNVRREFLRRLKYAFDARGIEIPYPHLTVYAGRNKDGSAPPLRLVQVSGEPE